VLAPRAAAVAPTPPDQIDPADPARVHRLWRWLLHGAERLAAVDLAAPDLLGSAFAPEADAIRREILVARGADPRAVAADLAGIHRALSWWSKDIEAGTSPILGTREALGRPAG
jgi:hypothetical protein